MKKKIMRTWMGVTMMAGLLAGHAGAAVELVRDGNPVATIVVAKTSAVSAQVAAFELQYHIQKITGATLPITNDVQPAAGTRIVVGESAETRALGLRSGDFSNQEYAIRFAPGAVVLIGRDKADTNRVDYAAGTGFPDLFDEQGTMYATYDFLERFCGVRWYLPTDLGITFTERKTLTVRGKDVRRAPDMKFRFDDPVYRIPADLCGDTVKSDQPTPALAWREIMLWQHRNRMGGNPHAVNHSFYGYYDRFLKDHPDWFAQGYAKTDPKPPQLCYTHPDVIRQVVQDARDYFDGKGLKPGAVAGGDGFALVPMDNSAWCRCPRCKAALTHGASAYVFGFVNAVAGEIKQSHSDKHLNVLAYLDWYPCPPFPLEPSVNVGLCVGTRCAWTPDGTFNAWSKRGTPLTLWMYYCFPALSAVQGNYRVFAPFFGHEIVKQNRIFRQAGVTGMKYEPSCLAYEQQSVLLDQVEFYVTWRLADNPCLDGNRLIAEFFDRYYGAASKPMRMFYETCERIFLDRNNYPKGVGGAELQWAFLGTGPRMAELGKLMARAKSLARTDPEKQRVALFEKGIWQYMVRGREAYLEGARVPIQSAVVPRIAAPAGADLAALDWSTAAVLANWKGMEGKERLDQHEKQMEGRLLHDGRHLYVRLQDMMDPAKLEDRGDIWGSDEYELFFGAERGPAYRQIGVMCAGRTEAWDWPEGKPWDSGVRVVSDRAQPDRWVLYLAFPLDRLVPGGVKAGGRFYLNVIRSMQCNDAVAWNPTLGGYHAPRRMGEIALE